MGLRLVFLMPLLAAVLVSQPRVTAPFARVAGTVEVLPLGTNGEALDGCKVERFFEINAKSENSSRFQGLSGKLVPFGEYLVSVRCGDVDGATSVVVVNRAAAFVVVSSARHVADYAPGGAPLFSIRVSNLGELAARTWVQLVGVFLDVRVSDLVAPSSGRATLPIEQPGAYVLTVFSGGDVLCRQALRIDNIGGSLEVRTGPSCEFYSGPGVSLRNTVPGGGLSGESHR